MSAAADAGANLLYAVSSSKDLYYLIAANFKQAARRMSGGALAPGEAEAADELAWGCLKNMSELASAIGCDQADVRVAAGLRGLQADYEDNLVVAAAMRAEADLLVTNDERLLRHCPVASLSAPDAVAWLRAQSS